MEDRIIFFLLIWSVGNLSVLGLRRWNRFREHREEELKKKEHRQEELKKSEKLD